MLKRSRTAFDRKETGSCGFFVGGTRGSAGQEKSGRDKTHRRDWCYRKLVKNSREI